MYFAVPADHTLRIKESEKRNEYQDLARELKGMKYESNGDSNRNWRRHQRFGIGTRGLGNKWISVDHPDYIIIKISKNTEKSPGDLKRLAVTETPVKLLFRPMKN